MYLSLDSSGQFSTLQGIHLSVALIGEAVSRLINATVIPQLQSVLEVQGLCVHTVCVCGFVPLCARLHESRLSRFHTLQLEVTMQDCWPVGMLLWFVEWQRPRFWSQGAFESRSSQCQ